MTARTLDRGRVPEPGELRPFDFPPIEHLELGNGIRVDFAATAGLPVVTFSLLLPAGALREPAEHAGLATLTGSLLESGTEARHAAALAEEIEGIGARLSVGAGWEVSFVDVTVLREHAEHAVALMAEIARAPAFPAGEVERVRAEQLAGIVQRRVEPRALANEMVSQYIFAPASPFARPLSGGQGSVAALEREDVATFHRAVFTPRGARLVVAGNISPDSVHEIGEGAFGDWTGDPLGRIEPNVEARSAGVEIVIVDRPGAVQSEVRIGHLGVARDTPDYFALRVVNTILGGSFSSRLNLNLRERHGYTYGVRSSFVMRRSPGPFLVSTAVETEVTGGAVREIVQELNRIRDGGITPSELDDARQYVAGTFPLPLQTTDGVASRLSELAIYGLPDSYLEDFASRILAVTAEEAEAAARNRIQPDRLAIVVVGDPERLRPQLEALELGPVNVVPPTSQ